MEWGKSTNQGTARVKLAHQFQKHVLLKDDFIAWFFDDATVAALRDRPLDMEGPPTSGDEQFQRVATWYTILRELYGDDAITQAVSSGILDWTAMKWKLGYKRKGFTKSRSSSCLTWKKNIYIVAPYLTTCGT